MVLETHLLPMVHSQQSQSAVKAFLLAARMVEKMGGMAPVVRKANRCLVQAVEMDKLKEERAGNKESAQIDNITRLRPSARSFQVSEVVALAYNFVSHCLWRSKAGGDVGQETDGMQFFKAKCRYGR